MVIEVTHIPKRSYLIDEVKAQNYAMKRVCDTYENVHWIPTIQLYLTKEGKINYMLFQADSVHRNKKGYELWTNQIKEKIKEELNERPIP